MSTPAVPTFELRGHYGLPEWAPSDDPDETAWRHGYVWCRHGRFDRGWAWWARVGGADLTARVHAGRAATLRQFGLHELAEAEDEAGLRAVDDWHERASLLIGLTADAIGAGDVAVTAARFQHAAEAVDALGAGLPADRQRLRFGWVAAEVQLLTGNGDATALLPRLEDGRVVAPPPYAAGTAYHLAKGLLFAGVVRADLATLDAAAALAPDSLAWAVHLGRHALGAPDAEAAAGRAWRAIVPPDEVRAEVESSATHQRLRQA